MSENGHRFGELDGHLSDAEEMQAASELSEQIDRMLAGQLVDSADPRLVMAERLRRLSYLLPPVDPDFGRRVLSPGLRPGSGSVSAPRPEARPEGLAPTGQGSTHRLAPFQAPVRGRFGFPWLRFALRGLLVAAAGAVVMVVLVLTVPGQTALARLATIFQLDTVQVGINVATATPAGARQFVAPRIERSLGSLEVAQQLAPIPIPVPRDLPADWSLRDATAVYYPDLPANVPLNIVLSYQSASGASLKIIEYFIQLGDNLTVDSLSRIDEMSTSAREIMVGGRRAILVESNEIQAARTLIWQQNGVLLEVEARDVSVAELLTIARSIVTPRMAK